MTTFLQDVRYAFRQLQKTPGFTITVLLTLALGIGANAAIFTLVNSVLLRNLPVADPKTLLRIGDRNDCCVGSLGPRDNGDYSYFSTDTYERLKKSLPEFEELAAMQAGFGYRPIIARRDGAEAQARSVMGEFVSGNYFRTFGLQPAAGRLLTDADAAKGAAATAVMSYDTWQREFSGNDGVVGSTFWVNTKAVTVVGVAPRGFYGDRMMTTPPEFYLPIQTMPMLANALYVDDPEENWLYIVGRVKPGTAVPMLQEKVNATLRQIYSEKKVFSGEAGKIALPKVHATLSAGGGGIQSFQDGYASQLHLLMAISGLVLLIACANIANLLLVRGMARRTEMSVRTALGAMRGRIVRQLLTESVVLAAMGGLIGLVVAYAGTRMLLLLAFPGAARVPIEASPSAAVIGFAFGVSLLTGVLFGVAPAWIAAQAKPADALRSSTRTTAAGASWLQRVLVVLQAALSLVLLVGAGLFSQSLNKLQGSDLKLDATNRYIVHINPQAAGYSTAQVEALYRTMEEHFHAVPGVVKVGISNYTPMEDNNWGNSMRVQGEPDLHDGASFVKANADYFDSVGTRVVMGRGIGVQDTLSAPPVTVVNEAFVKRFFKGKNPLGRRIGSPDNPGDYEVVGVVEDTVYQSVRWKDHTMYFVPIMQRGVSETGPIEKDTSLYAGTMVLETSRPMNDMEAIARRTLAGINPNLTVVLFQTFSAQIADQFTQERLVARLTTLFGGLALMLAALGLYGVTAYSVVRRTPEIGIRMALGAARSGVVGMILRAAAIQTGIGLAIGIPVALLSVRFVKAQLYEVTSADLRVMLGAILALGLAACVAGIVPARRAASVDPVQALRSE
ncbi:ABC transporter permease [Granulicella sibirica]|uniref:ABC efflux pump, inner membrane subunit n=1 Tax=Granulicella sibirica TaxID=2479048 RepID=A0A4Q0SYG3_9BACT|nr:ABC transporter permease [Granulicella sibirica]RXH55917.1 ABC efflux pump, inner membrane subunit [Granulicella sibirica]